MLTLPSSGSLIEGRLAGRGWLGQRERRRDVAGWVRRLAVGTLALAVLVVAPVSAQASQSAEQELAEKYSPVLSLESQQRQCGPGEAYRPTSVGIVLGRPGVLLRDSSGNVARRAPAASDLWRHAKGGYYIDLPGEAGRWRRGGQTFRATRRVYAQNLPTFAAAGAIFVPVYLAAAAIQWVVFHLSGIAPLIALDGRHGAVTAFLAVLIGGVGGLFASVIATAVVAVILDETDAGRRILAGQAYRRVLRRLRPLTRGMVTEIGTVTLLTTQWSESPSRSTGSSGGRYSQRRAC